MRTRRVIRKVVSAGAGAAPAMRRTRKHGNWLIDPKRMVTGVFVVSLATFFIVLAMGAVSHWTADNTLVTKAGSSKATIVGNVQYVAGRFG